MNKLIKIDSNVTVQQALDFVETPDCGGVVVFSGNVRNNTKGRKVNKLFFECYEPMALLEMDKIADDAIEKFALKKIAMLHIVGEKQPGEVVVVIAVAAPHRAAAFDACEYAIDTLKETVPIWKKEYFEDGEVWVAAHP
ncbi:molybdopterin synthase catalytic subunit [Chitinophaga pinensis]|uniref:Molybdopterin synthase catalytic subunit n=1 Tax=Chitinophaga pinensis (strain ATCC 43595 / DSM 2588 / LMG 13176 / NBRC 15968 / NCIMB 11800 / UQM 2034) TaxID=485918 RepID=A0A979GMV1_CHIPD|nr:molybdenum cofactor biosynthesis protein MoaE [Chitinophaga pinensis]ACU57708.1 molybdopterin biosynthesis MoaE protein [Chitinophaga pinensis DSM 2588]